MSAWRHWRGIYRGESPYVERWGGVLGCVSIWPAIFEWLLHHQGKNKNKGSRFVSRFVSNVISLWFESGGCLVRSVPLPSQLTLMHVLCCVFVLCCVCVVFVFALCCACVCVYVVLCCLCVCLCVVFVFAFVFVLCAVLLCDMR